MEVNIPAAPVERVVVRIQYPNRILALLSYLISACPIFFKHILIRQEKKNAISYNLLADLEISAVGDDMKKQDSSNPDGMFKLKS